MYILFIVCFILSDVKSEEVKNWFPNYVNESIFEEPFDYVSDLYLPNLVTSGNFDWISSSGTTLLDVKKSYIAFTGTRQNKAKDYSSVYTKESGIIVLCESILSTNKLFNINLNCKILDEKNLSNKTGIFFGSIVRSVQLNKDTASFIYCDPLWFKDDYNEPFGKCILSDIKNYSIIKYKVFEVCQSFSKCLGGFSVDMFADSGDVDIIFGLPFKNSTSTLRGANVNSMNKAKDYKGNFFNFGYSVSYAGNGESYVSSPVSDENSAFVQILNGVKFFPKNPKTQNFGGFGTSMDTIHVGKKLYGAIIGAPYQSKQGLQNVGAVFLACKDYITDIVFGENKYDYFGYAVARIGDLDYDGSDEFVVSAPSLNFEKPGKIYIYKTTSSCKIHKKPIQIYQSNIKGFGVSISRGFDIDFNGWPDFFVTSLNSTKPSLFKMPTQQKVSCYWTQQEMRDVYVKNNTFTVKIRFVSDVTINFNDYFFQVALDFLNNDEKRFELLSTNLSNEYLNIKIKVLLDTIDMDLRTAPFKVAIKGTRLCKKSDNENCFLSSSFNIKWVGCENIIKLTQYQCGSSQCISDLHLKAKPEINGSIIYLGNQKNYIRRIEMRIENLGKVSSPRTYVLIKSNPDIIITNVICDIKCFPLLSPNGQNTTVIIKETLDASYVVKLFIDILYKQLNVTKPQSSITFKTWGINEDSDMSNNEYILNYTILFKPNLTLSAKKAQNTIIDSRLKPPYLEASKRIQVHELGTELQFSYIIENKGPELKNVEFKFKFPFKTDDGRIILYVMDDIRLAMNETLISVLPSFSRNNNFIKSCRVQKEVINPLKVKAVESHQHEDVRMSGKISRLKRSIEDDKIITYVDSQNDSFPINPLSQDEKTNRVSSDRSTVIDCTMTSNIFGKLICSEVICKLDVIPVNSVFNFDFRTWVFTKTFFDAKLPDIIISTTLQSNIGDLPKGVQHVDGENIIGPSTASHNVLYSKMVVLPDKPLPLWPIILAIIIGIILLVIIIIIAYYCGFFKRKRIKEELKKKRENKRLKNEAENKSLMTST